MFLKLTFLNSDFIEGNQEEQAKIIKDATKRLYMFAQRYKKEE